MTMLIGDDSFDMPSLEFSTGYIFGISEEGLSPPVSGEAIGVGDKAVVSGSAVSCNVAAPQNIEKTQDEWPVSGQDIFENNIPDMENQETFLTSW